MTDTVFLQGKCTWCRVLKPTQWNDWRVTLYPNADSLEKIKTLKEKGLKNHLKKDDDGYFMTFKRDTEKNIRGRMVGFTPPEVVQADGKTPHQVPIGNGSDITVKLEVYKYNHPVGGKGIAARLSSVKVDTLVPYNPDRDLDPNQKEMLEGLDKQPAQVGGWP